MLGSYWRPPGQMQENDPNEFWHCAVPHIFSFLSCITLELIPSRLLKLSEELESPEFDLLAILLPPAHSFWSTHSLNTEFNVNPSGQMHLKQKLSFIFRIETSIFIWRLPGSKAYKISYIPVGAWTIFAKGIASTSVLLSRWFSTTFVPIDTECTTVIKCISSWTNASESSKGVFTHSRWRT